MDPTDPKEATKMFRTLTSILALAALLATAACNDITGPTAGDPAKTVSGGGHRTPQERNESPEILVPEDPGSGNGSDANGIRTNRLGQRRGRNDIAPGDDQGGGGGDDVGVITGSTRGRRGTSEHTPTP